MKGNAYFRDPIRLSYRRKSQIDGVLSNIDAEPQLSSQEHLLRQNDVDKHGNFFGLTNFLRLFFYITILSSQTGHDQQHGRQSQGNREAGGCSPEEHRRGGCQIWRVPVPVQGKLDHVIAEAGRSLTVRRASTTSLPTKTSTNHSQPAWSQRCL